MALLLGGDTVQVEIDVGPGAQLDLFDVAGTVAFDGGGATSNWRVRVSVADHAVLRMSGEPCVVASGADVTRSLDLVLAPSGRALIRDTLVLGRTGEVGGRVRNQTSIQVGDRTVCVEDTDLDPATHRRLPGMLGDFRVIDTITAIGHPPSTVDPCALPQFRLVADAGTITRFLGHELAPSPLHLEWARLLQPPIC